MDGTNKITDANNGRNKDTRAIMLMDKMLVV